MTAYIIRRLLWTPVLLAAVTAVTLALGLYGPGDPVQVMLGQHANPEAVERIKKERGLDQPFHVQYVNYVQRALQGDFGESFKYRGQPVGELIAKRLWVSIQLNAVVLLGSLLIGIPLGVIAAVKRNSWIDRAIVSLVVAGVSVPIIVIAPILLWLFARELPLWSASVLGVKIGLPSGGWDGIFSTKIILPVVVFSLGPIAVLARQTRASMIEVLGQDFIRVARAKGLWEWLILTRHALRAALIPLVTLLGFMVAGLVAGSFFVETIFGIPGIGLLGFEAFFARDYPVILALTLIIAVAYVFANLIVDIGYRFADPRIRYE